jgi:hypothetical protein
MTGERRVDSTAVHLAYQ